MIHHGLVVGDDGKKLSKRAEGATVASLRDAGYPAEAVRAYLEELGLPKHDVHLDLDRIRSLSVDVLAGLDDEELAARRRRSGRGRAAPAGSARPRRGARARRASVLEPPSCSTAYAVPETLGAVRRAARRSFPETLDKDEAKAVLRELKAVGGNLRGAARRADRPRARAGALGGAACAARATRRSAAPRTTLSRVRLYDTFTRSLVELPPRSRPGADVLLRPDGLRARARRERAPVRRRHVAALLAARDGLRRDSSSTTSPTSTTRSTTPRRARAPSSPSARPSGTSRTPATSGSACPTTCRRRPSRCRRSCSFIEELIDARPRVRGRRRRLLPRRELPRVRPALRPAARPGRAGRGAERAQGGPARLRALEGEQAGDRGHVVGLAVGPRPAGLAHRVLGDGRGDLRPGVRDPRRRPRPRLPAPRERGRAVAGARASVRADLGAQRDAPVHRREDVEVGRQRRRRSARRSTSGAARRCSSSSSPASGASRSTSREETMAQAAARRETLRNAFTRRPAEHDESRLGARSPPRSTTTSTRPRALAVLHEWASTRRSSSCCGAVSRSSASSRSRSASEAPAEVVELAERRAGRGPSATSRRPTGCATSSPRAGWEMRDEPDGGYDARARLVTPDLVYGRRAVREALRGHRARCSRSGRPSGRSKSEDWLAEAAAEAEGRPRAHRAGRDARPPGRPRAGRAVSLRRCVRARRAPRSRCSRCSTGSPTRATSAPSAGAPRARARRASSSLRTARPSSRPRSRARRPARSSTCRSRSSRTSRATSRR